MRLLSPDDVRHGDPVIVKPQGEVSRGVGLGNYQQDHATPATDYLIAAARRGAVLLYAAEENANA